MQRRKVGFLWLMVPAAAVLWLIFFPNAPYLITDLIHLRPRPDAPFWFDLILLVAFAWTGFILGLVSLVLMQEVIRRIAGSFVSWLFALLALAFSSFGIYLGRFLRWNSWDVFLNPSALVGQILQGARHPLLHIQSLAFSTLFAGVLLAMYVTVVAIVHCREQIKANRA
jgi:uncharacterized membrane protein